MLLLVLALGLEGARAQTAPLEPSAHPDSRTTAPSRHFDVLPGDSEDLRGVDAVASPTAGPAVGRVDAPTTCAAIHVAAPGELLTTIARRYATTLRAVRDLNPGLTLERLIEGDAVRVPERVDLPPDPPCLEREIRRGPRGRREIALTFDAGWVREAELERLLGALERLEAPGGFFLTGIFLRQNPGAAVRIAQAGHRLYNHSDTHPDFRELAQADIAGQLLAVERIAAESAVGTTQALTTRPYWRPPYGDRDDRVLRAAAAAGFQSVFWTVDSLDWPRDPAATVESVFKRVCERPFERRPDDPDPLDGAIVLFHVSATPTPEALERIVPHLRAKGYRFVDLPALLRP